MNDASRSAFTNACATVMPFGKYRGKTVARIGSNEEGLRYLDWLIGATREEDGSLILSKGNPDGTGGELRRAIETYLRHPAVGRMVDAAIEGD